MQAWDHFLLELDKLFGKPTIDKWLRSLTLVKFDACNIYLTAEDSFGALWVEEHILPIAKKQFRNPSDKEIKIHISSSDTKESVKEEIRVIPFLSFESDLLYPHCTLEQYVPTKENQISFEILCRLIGFDLTTETYQTPPEEKFNPIFIYGPAGIGKTHLLMATASFLRLQGSHVLFVKAETFTEHVVNAIRSGNMQNFRKTYRGVDVLIIDDIGVLGRKNATQEELFHTFNTLHTAGKQIILSSHVNPRLLEYIEERLISRFEWGLTLPLEKPCSTETLPELLKRRASFYGITLKRSVADYLLKHFPTPSLLSHALQEIREKTAKSNQIIELGHIEPLLLRLIKKESEEALSPEKIIDAVANTFGIRKEDILSKSQSRDITLPRQIAMYLLRHELKLPYMKIGDIFERDHSTVMTGIKQIQKGIDLSDSSIAYYLGQLKTFFAEYR